MEKNTLENIETKKGDAEGLILEVLKKVPSDKKAEILRIIEGYCLGIGTNIDKKKPA